MASKQGVPVDLYIYDLTNGLASMLSPVIIDEQPLLIGEKIDDKEIGRQVEGVWHTAIVVYDREYFYGAGGITSCEPGGTQLGAPLKIERLGETFVPRQLFVDYIQGLHSTTYTGAQYRLLEHNCNHFSDEVAQFLCGARIPKHILEQPAQLPPPLRLALTALLDNMLPPAAGNSTGTAQLAWDGGVRGARGARADSPDFLTLNTQIEQARAAGAELDKKRSTLAEKLARKERRAEKKRQKHGGQPPPQGEPRFFCTSGQEAVHARGETRA
ncbi:hypothetical protein O0L34_g18037 [Tuta absoluta]|nr:hypothetical protein O0L34_g18037 [Tuta absoluta]